MRRKTVGPLLALVCLAILLLCSCAKQGTPPPADPFLSSLELAETADRVVIVSLGHHDQLDYQELFREIQDGKTIASLAADVRSRVGEMVLRNNGFAQPMKLLFCKDGVVVLECILGRDAESALALCLGESRQWYRFNWGEKTPDEYWELGTDIDESEVTP